MSKQIEVRVFSFDIDRSGSLGLLGIETIDNTSQAVDDLCLKYFPEACRYTWDCKDPNRYIVFNNCFKELGWLQVFKK